MTVLSIEHHEKSVQDVLCAVAAYLSRPDVARSVGPTGVQTLLVLAGQADAQGRVTLTRSSLGRMLGINRNAVVSRLLTLEATVPFVRLSGLDCGHRLELAIMWEQMDTCELQGLHGVQKEPLPPHRTFLKNTPSSDNDFSAAILQPRAMSKTTFPSDGHEMQPPPQHGSSELLPSHCDLSETPPQHGGLNETPRPHGSLESLPSHGALNETPPQHGGLNETPRPHGSLDRESQGQHGALSKTQGQRGDFAPEGSVFSLVFDQVGTWEQWTEPRSNKILSLTANLDSTEDLDTTRAREDIPKVGACQDFFDDEVEKVSAPLNPPAPRKRATSPGNALVTRHADLYQERFETPYLLSRGKDHSLAKRLVTTYGTELAHRIQDAYFALPADSLAGRSGYTLGGLVSEAPRLAALMAQEDALSPELRSAMDALQAEGVAHATALDLVQHADLVLIQRQLRAHPARRAQFTSPAAALVKSIRERWQTPSMAPEWPRLPSAVPQDPEPDADGALTGTVGTFDPKNPTAHWRDPERRAFVENWLSAFLPPSFGEEAAHARA